MQTHIQIIRKNYLRAVAVALFATLSACSSKETRVIEPERVYIVQTAERHIPGAVEYVWEEPMVNVVDVPAGLDPEGYYYMPSHQEVVEIRQGRWNYYKKQP